MPLCNSSCHSPLSHEIGLNGKLTPKQALITPPVSFGRIKYTERETLCQEKNSKYWEVSPPTAGRRKASILRPASRDYRGQAAHCVAQELNTRSSVEDDELENRSPTDSENPRESLKGNSNHKQSYFAGRPSLLRPS